MDTSAIDPQSMRQYKETSGESPKAEYIAIDTILVMVLSSN